MDSYISKSSLRCSVICSRSILWYERYEEVMTEISRPTVLPPKRIQDKVMDNICTEKGMPSALTFKRRLEKTSECTWHDAACERLVVGYSSLHLPSMAQEEYCLKFSNVGSRALPKQVNHCASCRIIPNAVSETDSRRPNAGSFESK